MYAPLAHQKSFEGMNSSRDALGAITSKVLRGKGVSSSTARFKSASNCGRPSLNFLSTSPSQKIYEGLVLLR